MLSPRPLQDVLKRCPQDIFKTCLQDVFKTSSRHAFRKSSSHVFKTSWRRLQRNNFSSSKTSCELSSRRLQDVFKTSWKTKHCHAGGVLKTSSRNVSKTSSRRVEDQQMLAGKLWNWIFIGWKYVNKAILPYFAGTIRLAHQNKIQKAKTKHN